MEAVSNKIRGQKNLPRVQYTAGKRENLKDNAKNLGRGDRTTFKAEKKRRNAEPFGTW